jgi:hypothetical protein
LGDRDESGVREGQVRTGWDPFTPKLTARDHREFSGSLIVIDAVKYHLTGGNDPNNDPPRIESPLHCQVSWRPAIGD